jgi:uncharacterized YokU family protein
MEMLCDWCGAKAIAGEDTVFWELPDGSRAIQITNTPAVICTNCSMIYQTDEITKEIENQLFLGDTKKIGKSICFQELLELPRLLKRNYFDFKNQLEN